MYGGDNMGKKDFPEATPHAVSIARYHVDPITTPTKQAKKYGERIMGARV